MTQIQVQSLELVEDPREALTLVVRDFTLDSATETNVLDAYAPQFANARALAARARELLANPTDLKTDAKTARVLRIALKDERVAAEKSRKKLNEDALRYQRAVNGINAAILLITEPLEARLKEVEDAEEIAARKARDTLRATRAEELRPYCSSTEHFALDTMPAENYQSLFIGLKAAHDLEVARVQREEAAKVEAARKAEEERIAREQAAAAEKARLEAENARLLAEKQEAERLAALEREKAAEAARLAEESAQKERDRLAAEQAERDRLAAIEQEKKDRAAEAERLRQAEIAATELRLANERAETARQLAEAERLAGERALSEERERAAADQAEKDRIVAEQKAESDRLAQIEREKREALEKAEADRLAAEEAKRLEALEAARRAAAAPDREKLLAFADHLDGFVFPNFATEDAGCFVEHLKVELHNLACRARGFADKL